MKENPTSIHQIPVLICLKGSFIIFFIVTFIFWVANDQCCPTSEWDIERRRCWSLGSPGSCLLLYGGHTHLKNLATTSITREHRERIPKIKNECLLHGKKVPWKISFRFYFFLPTHSINLIINWATSDNHSLSHDPAGLFYQKHFWAQTFGALKHNQN